MLRAWRSTHQGWSHPGALHARSVPQRDLGALLRLYFCFFFVCPLSLVQVVHYLMRFKNVTLSEAFELVRGAFVA